MVNQFVSVETNGLEAANLDTKCQHEFTYQRFWQQHRSIRPLMGFDNITEVKSLKVQSASKSFGRCLGGNQSLSCYFCMSVGHAL